MRFAHITTPRTRRQLVNVCTGSIFPLARPIGNVMDGEAQMIDQPRRTLLLHVTGGGSSEDAVDWFHWI